MSSQIQDGVLYCLLSYGPDCWYRYAASLEPDMFDGDRREIFTTIARLNRAGQAVDAVMVAEQVHPDVADLVQSIGGTIWVAPASMPTYVEHLRRAWFISRARDIGAALQDSGDAEAARASLLAMESSHISTTIDVASANQLLLEDLSHRAEHGTAGVQTGLVDLDRLLGGLEPADLCVIAARPSMGKTALMLNIAAGCGIGVGIFSLEMSTSQLMTRLVAAHGVDYGRLRHPADLSDDDWSRVTKATVSLQKGGLWINDTGGLDLGAIESEAYRMVKTHGVGMICVDYLQLVSCKAESRLESVSEVSRRLKALAKNLKIPVIALSQMNRSIEKRGNPMPVMSDLRETGQIEQDADQIIFIHRPEVLQDGARAGEADLILAKNRGGETGKVTVSWLGKYQRFRNFEQNSLRRSEAA